MAPNQQNFIPDFATLSNFLDAQLSERITALIKVIELIDCFASRIRHKILRLPLMEIDKRFFDLVLDFVGEYSNAVEKTDFLRFDLNYQPSSGEMAFLSIWGRLYEFIMRKDLLRRANHLIVFLDELEVTLHPAWQQLLVDHMIWFFEKFTPSIKVHIIFASHSPLLLSDIPSGNCIYLQTRNKKDCRTCTEFPDDINTFGANIFDLYAKKFNLSEGTVGAFATKKINIVLRKLAEHIIARQGDSPPFRLDVQDKCVLEAVGDPILRKYIDSLKTSGLICEE